MTSKNILASVFLLSCKLLHFSLLSLSVSPLALDFQEILLEFIHDTGVLADLLGDGEDVIVQEVELFFADVRGNC